MTVEPLSPEGARRYFDQRGDRRPQFVEEWHQSMKRVQDAVDDLHDVYLWLKEDGHYKQSDRIRTIVGRLARAVPAHPIFSAWDSPLLIRNLARTYDEVLSVAESKKLLQRIDFLEAKLGETK